MSCDKDRDIEIKADGKPVRVKFEIGLTRPLFKVESQNWQPLQDTIFRKKKHRFAAPARLRQVLITAKLTAKTVSSASRWRMNPTSSWNRPAWTGMG